MSVLKSDRPFEGQILQFGDIYVLDAAPYVMLVARSVFKNARPHNGQGVFGKMPLRMPATVDSGVNLRWFAMRYHLALKKDLEATLEEAQNEHERRLRAAAEADQSTLLEIDGTKLVPAYEPYDYQKAFYNFITTVDRTLLADPLGKGKTESGLLACIDKSARPALVVCQSHLVTQWANRIKQFLPEAKVCVLRSKHSTVWTADFYVVSYARLYSAWDAIEDATKIKTVVFDEVQELRHQDTQKRTAARAASIAATRAVGLSATPIYNMGAEIWSIIDVIAPDSLGRFCDFNGEWSNARGIVEYADALSSYLRSRGLMLRRDIPYKGEVMRDVITLDADLESLKNAQDVMKTLALSVLSNKVGESGESMRKFDYMLRQLTGVSKARAALNFAMTIVNNGEPVILVGWHREVYSIWVTALRQAGVGVRMITGSESPAQKEQAKQDFIAGTTKVLILSLRSGAGIDGLQHVCSNVVFGELDWSPHVMDQVIGRVARPGQTKQVNAYFLTVQDGADPPMIETLGIKREQHLGVVEGKAPSDMILEDVGPSSDRLRSMAAAYLTQIGEAVPEFKAPEGLVAAVSAILSKATLPMTSEDDLQRAVGRLLDEHLVDVTIHREYKLTSRSRIDFLLEQGALRLGIECKVRQGDRSLVYAQVRRYAEDGIRHFILLAPWSGISDFEVDGSVVHVVDPSRNALRGGQ